MNQPSPATRILARWEFAGIDVVRRVPSRMQHTSDNLGFDKFHFTTS